MGSCCSFMTMILESFFYFFSLDPNPPAVASHNLHWMRTWQLPSTSSTFLLPTPVYHDIVFVTRSQTCNFNTVLQSNSEIFTNLYHCLPVLCCSLIWEFRRYQDLCSCSCSSSFFSLGINYPPPSSSPIQHCPLEGVAVLSSSQGISVVSSIVSFP